MDLLSLHLLLTRLVQKLNISAISSGLPMMYKLQIEVPSIQDRKTQVALSSLIAGYLLTIGEIFGLEDLQEGVGMEITHRKEHGQWFDGIKFPAADIPPTPDFPPDKNGYLSLDPILPFDNRFAVVNDICGAVAANLPDQRSPTLYIKVKEALLTDWNKDNILAELESNSSRQTSVSESKFGTAGGSGKNFLSVNGQQPTANGKPGSLSGSNHHHHSRPGSKHGNSGFLGAGGRVRTHATGGSETRSSSTSRSWTVRVDELRAVLSGETVPANSSADDSSSASECQSYTSSDGEELIGANGGEKVGGGSGRHSLASSSNGNGILHKKRSMSTHSRRDTASSDVTVTAYHYSNRGDIPPVPKLPAMMDFPSVFQAEEDFFGPGAAAKEKENGGSKTAASSPTLESRPSSRPVSSGGGKQMGQLRQFQQQQEVMRPVTGRVDVHNLLSGLDSSAASTRKRPVSRGAFKPPY